jgi:hypothetical protein
MQGGKANIIAARADNLGRGLEISIQILHPKTLRAGPSIKRVL